MCDFNLNQACLISSMGPKTTNLAAFIFALESSKVLSSGQNRRKSSPQECIFDKIAL